MDWMTDCEWAVLVVAAVLTLWLLVAVTGRLVRSK